MDFPVLNNHGGDDCCLNIYWLNRLQGTPNGQNYLEVLLSFLVNPTFKDSFYSPLCALLRPHWHPRCSWARQGGSHPGLSLDLPSVRKPLSRQLHICSITNLGLYSNVTLTESSIPPNSRAPPFTLLYLLFTHLFILSLSSIACKLPEGREFCLFCSLFYLHHLIGAWYIVYALKKYSCND